MPHEPYIFQVQTPIEGAAKIFEFNLPNQHPERVRQVVLPQIYG